jgi:hypothetical protein
MELGSDIANVGILRSYHSDYDRNENSREAIYNKIKSNIIADLQKSIQELIDIQCSDGNWNYSEYMQGLANGLILAMSCIREDEPQFKKAPEEYIFKTTVNLEDDEQYQLQMAAISLVAMGFWKRDDNNIKPEYDTQTLQDVSELRSKYEDLCNKCKSLDHHIAKKSLSSMLNNTHPLALG